MNPKRRAFSPRRAGVSYTDPPARALPHLLPLIRVCPRTCLPAGWAATCWAIQSRGIGRLVPSWMRTSSRRYPARWASPSMASTRPWLVGALQLVSGPTLLEAAAAEFAAELPGRVAGGGGLSSGRDGTSGGGGLSSGTGGCSSTSRGGAGRGGSRGGGGQGRGTGAVPDQYMSPPSGPAAAAGCGQRPTLVYTAASGNRVGWRKG